MELLFKKFFIFQPFFNPAFQPDLSRLYRGRPQKGRLAHMELEVLMLIEQELTLASDRYPKKASCWYDSATAPAARVLYFHGGGLLFGSRGDLPALHREFLTRRGYVLISFDYPLAPNAKLDLILRDVCASINSPPAIAQLPQAKDLPYFLWGRSAGAYLVLLAAASGALPLPPRGILSYYGYGFFQDSWHTVPAPFYQALPDVSASCLERLPAGLFADGSLEQHYSVYVYARQSGRWRELFFSGREKEFSSRYTLQPVTALPAPLFCAHSIQDPDVPYQEFTELCRRFRAARYLAPGSRHDFDQDTASGAAQEVLEATEAFLARCLESAPSREAR